MAVLKDARLDDILLSSLDSEQLSVLRRSLEKMDSNEIDLLIEMFSESNADFEAYSELMAQSDARSLEDSVEYYFEPKIECRNALATTRTVLDRHGLTAKIISLGDFLKWYGATTESDEPVLPLINPRCSGANNRNTISLIIQDRNNKPAALMSSRILNLSNLHIFEALEFDRSLSNIKPQPYELQFSEINKEKWENVRDSVAVMGGAWIEADLIGTEIESAVFVALFAACITSWEVRHFIAFYEDDADNGVNIVNNESGDIAQCEIRSMSRKEAEGFVSSVTINDRRAESAEIDSISQEGYAQL